MIFRVGFFVVASVAGFAVTQININCSRNRNSPIGKIPKNNDSSNPQAQIEEDQNDKYEDSIVAEEKEEVQIHGNKWNNATELELLKKVVKEMDGRRVSLSVKLLELHGLKQQQLDIAQLQRHLKAKMAEINALNVTVNALKAKKKQLHEEIKQNQLVTKRLEIARKRIVEMQAKMRFDSAQMKGQLMMLKENLLGFDIGETYIRNDEVEKKLRAVKDVELEVVGRKRMNKELQLEKRELTVKLVAAEASLNALSNMTESRTIEKLKEGIRSLRHANEDFSAQVERLQKNRLSIVEELVYQRWLNACLRFEIQDYYTPLRKTPKHNLKKKLSFESQVDTNYSSISSHISSVRSDETSTSTINSSQRSIPKKSGLIHYIKRWGKRQDDSSANEAPGRSFTRRKGLIRRFSMSNIPSGHTLAPRKNGDSAITTPFMETKLQNFPGSSETPTFPRARRVSFSDTVEPITSTFQDMANSVEGVSDNEEQVATRIEDRLIMSTIYKSSDKMEEEIPETSLVGFNLMKANGSSMLSKQEIESDKVETQMVNKSTVIGHTEDLHPGMPNVAPGESRVGDQRVQLMAAIIFFLFMLLVYFLFLSYGVY